MKVLLVEPGYKTKFPSMGLMKISTYHKEKGDEVRYIRGEDMYLPTPDRVYVTSIFTYDYHHVKRAVQFYRNLFPKAELWLGGLAATLIPDNFKDLGIDHIQQGTWDDVEDKVLDYSLHPQLDVSIMFTHRGCVRRCPWCVVHRHEPKFIPKHNIEQYVVDRFEKISCWDNNTLANPDLEQAIDAFVKIGKEVDFNQSLDIRLLTEDNAKLLKKIKIYPLRFAFDDIKYKKQFLRGVEICKSVGLKQECRVDVLYNFEDTPADFYERLECVMDAGWMAYPMLYKPIFTPDKTFLGEYWTQEELDRYHRFCKNTLGRIGDFLNPRCYVYYKGKRIKMKEVIKKRAFDIPPVKQQREYMNKQKGNDNGQMELNL